MAAVAPRVGVVVPQDPLAEDNLVAALLFAVVLVAGAALAGGKQTVYGFAVTSSFADGGCGGVWVMSGWGRSVAAGGEM